jgi:hypothetical protein
MRQDKGCAGSLGGCGGKIVNDIIRGGYHMAKEPDEMRVPGIGVNRAVLCCILYYVLVHVYNILKPRQGTTLVILLLVRPLSLCSALHRRKFMKYPHIPIISPLLFRSVACCTGGGGCCYG